MSKGFPPGWTAIELADHVYIAGRIGWRGLKAEEYTLTGPIFLSVPNLNHGDEVNFSSVHHISQERYDESSEIQLKIGDTLLVKDGAGIGKLGFVARLPEKATVNSSLLVVRPNDALLTTKFLFYYLKGPQFQQIALERISGSATPHLFQKDIKQLRVLVPPTAEQLRIVAMVDALLAKVRSAQERLDRIPRILKRFRKAVVTAACNGELTADWRANQRPPGLKKQGGDEGVPLGWRPASVGDVIDGLKYGTAQKCTYDKRGTPVLRIPNVANGTIDHKDLKYAVLPPKERESLRLKPGDILIIRSNGSVSLVGRPALVRMEEDGFAYAGYLIRLRPRRTVIDSRFLNLVLSSQEVRVQIELEARSTSGVNNINSEEVRALELALPPVDEQKEILRRVEAMFKLADRLQGRYEKGKTHVDKLTPSILAKAFRGELVPTEAELAWREGRSYETAEQLLARIKTENDNIAKARPRARKKAVRA